MNDRLHNIFGYFDIAMGVSTFVGLTGLTAVYSVLYSNQQFTFPALRVGFCLVLNITQCICDTQCFLRYTSTNSILHWILKIIGK